MSLFNKKIDEGRPGRQDGFLDAVLAETLLSKWAVQDQLLHLIHIFGQLHRHRQLPTGFVVNLGIRGDKIQSVL